MENLLSALLIIIFLWFVIGMIIPLKAAPFFKSKRRIKIFAVTLLSFIVVGALLPKNENTNGTQSKSPGVNTQKEKKVSKIGDTIHSKNFDITILNKDVSDTVTDKSGYFQSTANGTFIILTVQYKNTANRAMRLDNSAFKLELEDKTYSPVTIIMTSKDNIFLDTINPGIEKTGKLYFDVPKDIANSNDFVLKLSGNLISDNSSGEIMLN